MHVKGVARIDCIRVIITSYTMNIHSGSSNMLCPMNAE